MEGAEDVEWLVIGDVERATTPSLPSPPSPVLDVPISLASAATQTTEVSGTGETAAPMSLRPGFPVLGAAAGLAFVGILGALLLRRGDAAKPTPTPPGENTAGAEEPTPSKKDLPDLAVPSLPELEQPIAVQSDSKIITSPGVTALPPKWENEPVKVALAEVTEEVENAKLEANPKVVGAVVLGCALLLARSGLRRHFKKRTGPLRMAMQATAPKAPVESQVFLGPGAEALALRGEAKRAGPVFDFSVSVSDSGRKLPSSVDLADVDPKIAAKNWPKYMFEKPKGRIENGIVRPDLPNACRIFRVLPK
ncbi:unnamed protein product [Effrenium voratum]|nr:unnamed protein product [Effrenium voratum]